MSAIAGVFRRDGAPACEGDLRPVLDAMAPRIRGEWIVWSSGAVVLAASQPVDASGAEPPFARGRDGVARVADARLDGETAAPASPDAERDAVLDAYQSGNLGRLAGDLAVAVWDAERRRVTCARDALGTKPLYFAESESSFAFATEPRALARLPGVDSTPDPAAIAWHLALRPFGAQRSFYRGVRPVPPGARVTCDARGVRIDPPDQYCLLPRPLRL